MQQGINVTMSSRGRFMAGLVVMALAVLCMSSGRGLAEEEHHHHEQQQSEDVVRTTGVDEHIGAKLPLDLLFRDERGGAVRLGDLVKGPTIILPVYYGCTNVCYSLQWGLARVLPQLKSKPLEGYRVISVSFDERETPVQAARFKKIYLTAMQTPFPEEGWRFLTGDYATIHRLTDAAGFHFQRRGNDFVHPVTSLVVSGDGVITRYLYGTTFLAKDLTLALVEAREGKTSISVRRLMEYCFTFDPVRKTYVFNMLRVSAAVVLLCCGGFVAFLLLGGKGRKR